MKDKVIDITTIAFFVVLIGLAAFFTFKNPKENINNNALKTWFSPQVSQPEDIENSKILIENEWYRGRNR